jgi:Zn-finger nucleic acid-binding protein
MALSCPKCHAEMRMYERNGIHIDQCSECRGVFLDRGELEHLITAETQWAAQQAPPPPPPPPAPPAYPQGGYPPPPPAYPQGGYGYGKPYKKRKSFLEELFD